jgi:6-phosphogluconolactonase
VTRLTTCPDAESVAARAAADVMRALERALHERGVAHLALSGGTTPGRTYELLAADVRQLAALEVWFADERCVEAQDEQSNYRLAAETLLDPAGIPPERVHRMQGELGPEDGAERYADELTKRLAPDTSSSGAERDALTSFSTPVLDIVVLGIGPDGHIASLFPGASTLSAGEHAICHGVRDSPKPPPERITLSLAVLRAARSCLLLATGAGKADAINAMLGEPSRHVPASLLRRERLSVIVDDAAGPKGPRP